MKGWINHRKQIVEYFEKACLDNEAGLTEQAREVYETGIENLEKLIRESSWQYSSRYDHPQNDGVYALRDVTAIVEKYNFNGGAKRLYERIVEDFEKQKEYTMAADMANRAGMTERAMELYEKGDFLYYAGRMAEKAGKIDRAIDFFCRGNYLELARKVAEAAGMHEKVTEIVDMKEYPTRGV